MGASGIAALAIALFVALPLVLHFQRRRDEELVCERWCFRMTPAAAEEYELLRDEIERSLGTADATHAAAMLLTGTARRRMLDLAVRAILERSEPLLREQLRLMLEVAWHLAAVSPPPHLERARFALAGARRLAALQTFLHSFLVGTRERFAFRVHTLGWVLHLVVRALRRGEGADRAKREQFDAAWGDYHVVGDETLQSYRLLLESIWAAPAADTVPRPAA
jgi:hypothetical protein